MDDEAHDTRADELDRIAEAIRGAGLRRTESARRAFRDSFASDEAYREHMRRIGEKARAAKLRLAVARRRARAAGAVAKVVKPTSVGRVVAECPCAECPAREAS